MSKSYSTLIPICNTASSSVRLNYDYLMSTSTDATQWDLTTFKDNDAVKNNYNILAAALQYNYDVLDTEFTTLLSSTYNVTLTKVNQCTCSIQSVTLYNIYFYKLVYGGVTNTFSIIDGLSLYNYITFTSDHEDELAFRGNYAFLNSIVYNYKSNEKEQIPQLIMATNLDTLPALAMSKSTTNLLLYNIPGVFFSSTASLNFNFLYYFNVTGYTYTYPPSLNTKPTSEFLDSAYTGNNKVVEIAFEQKTGVCFQTITTPAEYFMQVKSVPLFGNEPIVVIPNDPPTDPDAHDFGDITMGEYADATPITVGQVVYYLMTGNKAKITDLVNSITDATNKICFASNSKYDILAAWDNFVDEEYFTVDNSLLEIIGDADNPIYMLSSAVSKDLTLQGYDTTTFGKLPVILFGFGTPAYNIHQYVTNIYLAALAAGGSAAAVFDTLQMTTFGMAVSSCTKYFPGFNQAINILQDGFVNNASLYDGVFDTIEVQKIYDLTLTDTSGVHDLLFYLLNATS